MTERLTVTLNGADRAQLENFRRRLPADSKDMSAAAVVRAAIELALDAVALGSPVASSRAGQAAMVRRLADLEAVHAALLNPINGEPDAGARAAAAEVAELIEHITSRLSASVIVRGA